MIRQYNISVKQSQSTANNKLPKYFIQFSRIKYCDNKCKGNLWTKLSNFSPMWMDKTKPSFYWFLNSMLRSKNQLFTCQISHSTSFCKAQVQFVNSDLHFSTWQICH